MYNYQLQLNWVKCSINWEKNISKIANIKIRKKKYQQTNTHTNLAKAMKVMSFKYVHRYPEKGDSLSHDL